MRMSRNIPSMKRSSAVTSCIPTISEIEPSLQKSDLTAFSPSKDATGSWG